MELKAYLLHIASTWWVYNWYAVGAEQRSNIIHGTMLICHLVVYISYVLSIIPPKPSYFAYGLPDASNSIYLTHYSHYV